MASAVSLNMTHMMLAMNLYCWDTSWGSCWDSSYCWYAYWVGLVVIDGDRVVSEGEVAVAELILHRSLVVYLSFGVYCH